MSLTRAPAKPMTSHRRRKGRIGRLRRDVARLEAQLHDLHWQEQRRLRRLQWKQVPEQTDVDGVRASSPTNAAADDEAKSSVIAIWKDMAARHETLRDASEQENARLRKLVDDRLSIIRKIQQLTAQKSAQPVCGLIGKVVMAHRD